MNIQYNTNCTYSVIYKELCLTLKSYRLYYNPISYAIYIRYWTLESSEFGSEQMFMMKLTKL